jgi:ribosomal protein L14E/L6E/L27E
LDIPSSNFISDKGKKTNKYAIKFEDYMTSIPTTKLKHEDPSKILHSMPLPEKYRDVMGPDPTKLEKYNKEKQKKATAQRKLLQDKMEERETSIQRKKGEEDKEISMLPTEIYQDEQGRIRDKSGKIITISVTCLP